MSLREPTAVPEPDVKLRCAKCGFTWNVARMDFGYHTRVCEECGSQNIRKV